MRGIDTLLLTWKLPQAAPLPKANHCPASIVGCQSKHLSLVSAGVRY